MSEAKKSVTCRVRMMRFYKCLYPSHYACSIIYNSLQPTILCLELVRILFWNWKGPNPIKVTSWLYCRLVDPRTITTDWDDNFAVSTLVCPKLLLQQLPIATDYTQIRQSKSFLLNIRVFRNLVLSVFLYPQWRV